ncbi:universal stress protein [Portibacter marinus]|uniref:universal stress protein n=1 Tax=Portibacter marinus TaxID=2898660 RepID=UPI001F2BB898|nr:universal stress protein [Portibacter marinus]
MANVKIYGAETSRYEYFKYSLEQFLRRYNLNLEIEEIKNVSQIIEDHVESIPTLRINSHVDIVYSEKEGIENFVTKSKENIIQEFAPDLLTKILVPIDFSENSLNAFNYALGLAKEIGAEIELLYVNHPSPMVVDGQILVDDVTVANRKYNLHRIVEKTRKELERQRVDKEFVMIRDTYMMGLAADKIIEKSKDKDLVILGNTGESASKKILGSVSLKVSSHGHCPAMFIPPNLKYSGLKKIVYAYAPTSYDQKVLKSIAKLARKFESEIHIIHVDDGTKYEPYDISSYVSHMYEDIQFICEEVQATNVSSGVNNYAENIKADLIILSKKKKKLLEQIIQKSQTKSTLMKSQTPIMVFHNDDIGCLCGGACRQKPDANCHH